MAWAHRNTATTTFTSATDPLTGITAPTVVDGDLLELDVCINSDTVTISTPTGGATWVLVRDTALTGRSLRMARFRKIAASEPGSYSIDLSAAQRAVVHVSSYSGVNNASPVDVESGATDDTIGTTIDAPTVTTTQANDLVSVGYATNNAGSWTQDGSPAVTERGDADAGAASPSGSKGDFNQASAGATGAITATPSGGSNRGIGHTTAYKEAVATSDAALRQMAAWNVNLRM